MYDFRLRWHTEKGRLVYDLTKGPFGAINEICSVRVIAFIGGITMRELFEKFRSYSIVSIIVSALCGLALLIFPAASIRYISLAFGGALLIMGAVGVVQYFRKTAGPVVLSAGLVSMVCGVIVCAKYQSILTLVEFLFGASIFCGGIIGLVIALRREMRLLPGWGVNLALTVVSVILGIVCMVNPFHTALALARMLGVALLLYAVMEAVGYAQLRKVGRAVEDAVNRTAPIIDENARVLDDQDESVK